ncbi:unnamed protein product [Gongylonema pulchrum]|uniref:Ovule protein n=1 Tax=Gongylonema pulchrum TaxID=637853 RepID=A0A183ET58_9BILA|nr:unnamed protein product [Gongylonema pulchrum]
MEDMIIKSVEVSLEGEFGLEEESKGGEFGMEKVVFDEGKDEKMYNIGYSSHKTVWKNWFCRKRILEQKALTLEKRSSQLRVKRGQKGLR